MSAIIIPNHNSAKSARQPGSANGTSVRIAAPWALIKQGSQAPIVPAEYMLGGSSAGANVLLMSEKPNFKWARHLAVTRGHIALALEQVGETLLARRYSQQLLQSDVAESATSILDGEGEITPTDISNLEKGLVSSQLRGDHKRLKAIVQALEFPERDAEIYVDLFVTLDVRLRDMD